MEALPTFLFFAISCLTGALFTWQVLAQRQASELDKLDREMTQKVRTTLSNYCELEGRMVGILKNMTEKEMLFNERLYGQRESISKLQAALGQSEGDDLFLSGTDLNTSFEKALEPISAAFGSDALVELPNNVEDLGVLFDELERETKYLTREQLGEVEHQIKVVEELATESHVDETLADALGRRDLEIEGWKTSYGQLVSNNEDQIRLLNDCFEEFKPFAEQVEGQEQLVQQWTEKLEVLESSTAGRILELESLVGELQPKAAEFESSQRDLHELNSKLEGSLMESAVWQDKLETASCQQTELESELENLRNAFEENQIAFTELQSKYDDQLANEGRLNACMVELKQGHKSEIEGLSDRLHELEPLTGRVKELESEVESLGQDLKGENEKIAEMTSALQSHSQTCNELESTLCEARSEAEGEKTTYEKDIKQLQSHFDCLQIERDDLQQQFDQSIKNCKEQRTQLEELQVILAANVQELSQRDKALGSKSKKLKKLEAGLADAKEDGQQLLEKLTANTASLDERSHEVDELQSILDAVELAKGELEFELEKNTTDANRKGEQIAELQLALTAATGSVESTQQDMLSKLSTLKEAKQMFDALRPMLDGLENTIGDIETE